jgi:hypothetical protein
VILEPTGFAHPFLYTHITGQSITDSSPPQVALGSVKEGRVGLSEPARCSVVSAYPANTELQCLPIDGSVVL